MESQLRAVMKIIFRATLSTAIIIAIINPAPVVASNITVDVPVDNGLTGDSKIGVGFDHLTQPAHILTINLNAPLGKKIVRSSIVGAGSAIWTARPNTNGINPTHTYKVLQIDGGFEDRSHAVMFNGTVTGTTPAAGTASGESTDFEVAVAEINLTAPSISENNETAFDNISPNAIVGYVIPSGIASAVNVQIKSNAKGTIKINANNGVTISSTENGIYGPSIPDKAFPFISGNTEESFTFFVKSSPLAGTITATFVPTEKGLSSSTAPSLNAVDHLAVSEQEINLEIYRADSDPTAGDDFGALVSDADEDSVGSFTVANLNDTDGDGTQDRNDNSVIAGTNGQNEHDLMRIILERPKPDRGGHITLSLEEGNVRIWKNHTKGTEVTGSDLTVETSAIPSTDDHNGDGNPDIVWWVEATDKSTSLQDIKLTMSYKPMGYSTPIAQDTVRATAVWATVTNTITERKSPGQLVSILGTDWVKNAGPPRVAAAAYGGTGVNLGTRTSPIGHNVIIIEFRISPNDIMDTAKVPVSSRPLFDITRQKNNAGYAWSTTNASPRFAVPSSHYPLQNEQGNDDKSNAIDETDEPSPAPGGRMWVIDTPGGSIGVLTAARFNFREFMRVRFDSIDPGKNVVSGSRCSEKKEWYSKTTNGEASSPNELAIGNFKPVKEVLSTGVLNQTTTPGTRHHAHNKGLGVAGAPGATPEGIFLRLIDSDPGNDDLLHSTGGLVFGKIATTHAGDQVAYTVVGHYASRLRGWIAGQDGTVGEYSVELAHEFKSGGINSTSVAVTGVNANQPKPFVPTMVLGAITPVTISGAHVEADSNSGGTQTVSVQILDADSSDDDLLHSFNVTIPRLMTDELGGNVVAIKHAVMNGLNTSSGIIAAKADGEIIGPHGESGENPAEIVFELSGSDSNSPEKSVKAPVYKMTAPIVTTNPIPIGGSSIVTMNIFKEATGFAGTEPINVKLIDQDSALDPDDVLQNITVAGGRPVGCFPNALIGPFPVTGLLLNPAPGGEVKGPAGSSGEARAEIGYEIGNDITNSRVIPVRAN